MQQLSNSCFHAFHSTIETITLPHQFTDPFSDEPHEIALKAADELKKYLTHQTELTHNFGINSSEGIGKMFGVLVVKNKQNQFGYLMGFSGKLQDETHPVKFVPSIFEANESTSFLSIGLTRVTDINKKIKEVEKQPVYHQLKNEFASLKAIIETEIQKQSTQLKEAKKLREKKRNEAKNTLNQEQFDQLNIALAQESIENKKAYKHFVKTQEALLAEAEKSVKSFENKISTLKNERSTLSSGMQEQLFENYTFLNESGQTKSVFDIFAPILSGRPPAAAGECATPKMLQYAFKNGLKPIAAAEFWWGKSQKSAIRVHGNFYPACEQKCRPILAFMLG